jgi:MFS family permease
MKDEPEVDYIEEQISILHEEAKENERKNYRNSFITDHISAKEKYLHSVFEFMHFTKFHFFMVLSIFLIKTAEGTEVFCLSITSNMLESSFGLEKSYSSIIIIMVLSGNLIGCMISMLISNSYPRKNLIIIGSLLLILPGLISIFSVNILTFIICRHIVNIGIGLIYAPSLALLTESINNHYRGFILNLIMVSGSAGEIFISMMLGNIINLEINSEWKKIYLLAALPVTLFLIRL